jgi:hypothetical protein
MSKIGFEECPLSEIERAFLLMFSNRTFLSYPDHDDIKEAHSVMRRLERKQMVKKVTPNCYFLTTRGLKWLRQLKKERK